MENRGETSPSESGSGCSSFGSGATVRTNGMPCRDSSASGYADGLNFWGFQPDHARLWHPWLRINRVLRVMLHTRWSAEAWAEICIRGAEPSVDQSRCGLEGQELPRRGSRER